MPTAHHRSPHTSPRAARPALTLVELVVVLTILVALAGLVVPQLSDQADSARNNAALASLTKARDALAQYWSDCKYEIDTGFSGFNRRILTTDLLVNRGVSVYRPSTRLGWRGPYLEPSSQFVYKEEGSFTGAYGTAGDPCVTDPWAHPIVIQFLEVSPGAYNYELPVGEPWEVRLISAGANGKIEIDESLTNAQLAIAAEAAATGDGAAAALLGDDLYVSLTLR